MLLGAAGVGSVMTASGQHELEASVMTDEGRCGAVALVKHIANPARLAQQVGGKAVPPWNSMPSQWHHQQDVGAIPALK